MKNKGFFRGALFGALTVLLILGTAACGKNVLGNIAGKIIGSSEETKLQLMDVLIDKYYMGLVDKNELEEGLYKGYIEALGDPYSQYFDAEETAELQESISGEYSGVGAVMMQDYETGIVNIVQVYEDSPAEEAGMKADDILYKVNGEEVTGVDLSEVVTWIKGEEGTTVDITVIRGEEAEEITMTATRRKIIAQTVTYEMKENNIGYIDVMEFDAVTAEQYKEALDELEKQGMQALVVDLRSNPGGSLDTVVKMLDEMLPEGRIVTVNTKAGAEQKYDSDEEHQFTKPLVVLMNGYSASASEIYAGAIQEFGTGQIVGTQSYGKGVVQQLFDLQDGSSLKLTIAEYLIGEDRSINGEGVTPDVEVPYEYDENRPDWDNQLEKALEILANQL